MKIANRAQAIKRLEAALAACTDPRLRATIAEMLNQERARAASSVGIDVNDGTTRSTRCVTNPRTMPIKLKREKYDTRIELDDPATIEQRRQEYLQKRAVFQRG